MQARLLGLGCGGFFPARCVSPPSPCTREGGKRHQPLMSPAGGRYPGFGGCRSPICRSITVSAWNSGTEGESVGPRSPVHRPRCIPVFGSPSPSLSIRTCSPASTCFPGSPALPTSRKMAKGTRTQAGSCLHPGLGSGRGFPAPLHPSPAAPFAREPSAVAFSSIISGAGWAPRICAEPRAGLGTWWEDHFEPWK